MSRFFKKFRRYLKHCFQCQFNQIKKHRFYEKLILIINSFMSFHIIAINFIIALSNAYDALLIVTNKFFRRIFFMIDHIIYETKNWTSLFLNRLQLIDWNLSYAMILNRNSRFMSNFWQAIFVRLRTKFLTNIIFHSLINDDSKRTNQIMKIVFRYLIITYSNIN